MRNLVWCLIFTCSLTGCSNVKSRTASLCDVEESRFLFIPYNRVERCRSVSGTVGEGSLRPHEMPPIENPER